MSARVDPGSEGERTARLIIQSRYPPVSTGTTTTTAVYEFAAIPPAMTRSSARKLENGGRAIAAAQATTSRPAVRGMTSREPLQTRDLRRPGLAPDVAGEHEERAGGESVDEHLEDGPLHPEEVSRRHGREGPEDDEAHVVEAREREHPLELLRPEGDQRPVEHRDYPDAA